MKVPCLLPLVPILGLVLLPPSTVVAQGTLADYERARNLRQLTTNKVMRDHVQTHWFREGQHFWYRINITESKSQFLVVDAAKGEKRPAFNHERLAESLAESSKEACNPARLPFDWIQFDDESNSIRFRAFDKGWSCSLETYDITTADVEQPPRRPRQRRRGRRPANRESPDGQWEAFIRDHQLVLRDKKENEEHVIGADGTEDHFYEDRYYWSPDSRKLVALQTEKGDDRKVYLIESTPKNELQPKLHSYNYRKPGDKIPLTKPRLFHLADRKPIPIDNALFPNPWRIGGVRWQADSRRFNFLYNQRGHQILRVVAVDADTGESGIVIDEQSDTFLDYTNKEFTHYVNNAHELIWMSERDGWNHLYLYDSRTGVVKNQITKGQWVVRSVLHVDDEKRQIWFQAGGIYPEQDPYYIHYCRVNFDGSGLVPLTDGNGTHSGQFSPNREFLVDTYSRVDMAPITELRRTTNGSLICRLEEADISGLLTTGWRPPERFVAKGRDGATDIFGVIWHPTTFDEKAIYPIIEHIYAGPHGSFVPKRFAPYFRTQSLAELGFIVVQIDGMGTSHRSKPFHDICWKNLGDSGFPDRMAWIKAAARKYPYLDLTRVGIYGGSAGGQSATRALLAHGDFYKVAVSDCGCHDNRMDKIWWNEQWMGWPVGAHYEQQSNVTNAHKLNGKLLLIVGELDRNVDPASTMQVVDALIKADKDFDLLVVPGGGHGIAEQSYGTRRRRDFFVRHLFKVEPRQEMP